ncbi:DUF6262 family protein [Sinomonas humi]|uniref:DUF6262 family protein n=1 Tax=Sinomonas humi TaxID=1338436 RepID=UPI000690BA1C|nr:DUF6262 family protein [Sinomonas humi]
MTRTNSKPLAEATRRRTRAAEEAVAEAITRAEKAQIPITIAAIASAAAVSTDFIYRHPVLRLRAEEVRKRSQRRPRPYATEAEDAPEAASPLVRRLMHQMKVERKKHQDEKNRLHAALEAAHGELLHLRRRLEDSEKTRRS